MIHYIALFSIVNIFLFLSLKYKKVINNDFFIYLTVLSLVFFSGFRSFVGVDYESYLVNIENIVNGGYSTFEFGSRVIINALSYFGFEKHGYFLFFSIFTSFFTYKAISFFSQRAEFSLYIYSFFGIFYLASFNSVRQSLSVAIFVFSLRYILSGKWYLYIFYISVATMFHMSAVFCYPLYFIYKIKFNRFYFFVGGIVSVGILVLLIPILLEMFFSINYLDVENSTSSRLLILIFTITSTLLVFFTKEGSPEYEIMRKVLYCSIPIYMLAIMLPSMSTILIRVNAYFVFPIVIMLPVITSKFFIRLDKLLVNFSIYVVIASYFFASLYFKGEAAKLIPFHFIFEN
ncbi:EpsG family protein [Vibrio harveyi]